MKIASHFRKTIRRLVLTAFAVWSLGLAYTPAWADVTVDQAPLTVQASIPPNIMLMLDDSGSMASDYMPDLGYLEGTSCPYWCYIDDLDAVRDPDNNGTYYNPTVTYTPPPTATGGRYPDSPGLDKAYYDGFRDRSADDEKDVTKYTGTYDYYETYTATVPSSYDPIKGCESGDRMQSDGQCAHGESTKTYYEPKRHGWSYSCDRGDSYDWGSGECVHTEWTYTYYSPDTPTCNQGGDYDSDSGQCISETSRTANLFTYSVSNGSGGYVRHFVGKSLDDCAAAPSGSDCDYSAATQQNVANWFSYYRTRMLMAKSGLMSAFSGMNEAYRVGFGSINNNNIDGITATGKYTNDYNSKYLAKVQPFGDGSSGTQKAYFWSWVNDITPNDGTPLRKSLDAVGQYYGSDQPWSVMSSDPDGATGELACRQSYSILTTDGFWNGSAPAKIGNVDGTDGSTISNPKTDDYTYTAEDPFKDDQSDTLADVAMKYWRTDLRTTSNEVPVSTEDLAFWQHMTTFTLGLGFDPENISPSDATIDKIFDWSEHPDDSKYAIDNFSWPTPSKDNINNIADLAHAAVNGHGGFYSAKSPEAFASGIKEALKRVSSRTGTGASLAANSTSLKTGTVAYQANYYTAKWKGDLKALSVDPVTNEIATAPNWTAATALPAAASRKIYTYNSATGTMVAFQYDSLSADELAALGDSETVQKDIIAYLRGDDAKEQSLGGSYRDRDTPLGDIVDSQPVYVGAPNANEFFGQTFDGSTTFTTYAGAQIGRTPTIYVAGNDGMLHGFRASDGVETFAYMPAAVIKNGIKDLADPDYEHQFFNDGELTIADVYFPVSTTTGNWKTVLVGTTGRGTAKAVYALDVTDPANVKLLWERSAADGDSNADAIGQMTGKPVIAQVGDGAWAVIIGNGYNSVGGTAELLQFSLDDGSLYTYGTNSTTSNGLAAPAVWMNSVSSGLSTIAYAGDLYGHVWSFTLNDGSNSNKASSGALLFTAKDSTGTHVQPITGGMLVGKKPGTTDVWVFFGTGKYLQQSDLVDTNTQTWYGLIVQSTTKNIVSNLAKDGRSALVESEILTETAATSTSLPTRTVTSSDAEASMDGKSGWYMDLLTPDGEGGTSAEGERIVTAPQFQGNVLLATTRIPESDDLCNPSGRGWILAVDPFTGTNPTNGFFDTNGDGKVDASDEHNGTAAAGVGFNSLPNNPIFVGGTMLVSFDNGTTSSIATTGNTDTPSRVSWRELITQ